MGTLRDPGPSGAVGPELRSQRRRALVSAFFGGAVEMYDFFLYSLLAAVALGPLFFPSVNPVVGQIASFATVAVAYVSRPLGALLMTVVGDRLGRKKTLLITVLGMGFASVLVGVLPTYGTIGVWAPILLTILRFAQGLSAGAEYGGGVLMALEYSNEKRRGLSAAVPQAGTYVGILLANLAILLATLLPRAEFLAWGWRLPFIVSAVLLGVTVWIRARVHETPVFEEAKRTDQLSARPFTELFRTNWRTVLSMAGIMFSVTTVAGFTLSFMPAYAVSLGFTSTQALAMSLSGVSFGLVLMPIFGRLSDSIGRKRLTLAGLAVIPFAMWAAVALIHTRSLAAGIVGVLLIWTGHSIANAPAGAWLAERFPTRYRYGGISVAYQFACIGTGIFPLVASSILAGAGGPDHYGWLAVYMGAIVIVGLTIAVRIRETSHATFAELDRNALDEAPSDPTPVSGAATTASSRSLTP